MHVRIVTFTDAKDIDAGVTFVRERVIPILSEQRGYRGLNASADRAAGVFGVLSLWDTARDRDANETAMKRPPSSGNRSTKVTGPPSIGLRPPSTSSEPGTMWDLVEAAEHRQAIEDLRAGEEFEDDLAALEDFDPLAIGRRSRDRVPGAPGPRSRL